MIKLFSKRYDAINYHCVHFVVDVWMKLTGHDLSCQFEPLLLPVLQVHPVPAIWEGFVEINEPESPCVVLMRSGTNEPHMGVFSNGRVLHLRETGPHSAVLPQLRLEYKKMRFFICEN